MIPALAGDVGTPYVLGVVVTSHTMVSGSTRVTFNGRSVMTLPGAITTGGPIVSATILSQKVTVEGRPIIGIGAVTALLSGFSGGIVLSTIPTNVSVV